METKKEIRVHRIGTVTSGIALILYGILFLLYMFIPTIDFRFVFRLWPCILILMGIELLVGNYMKSDTFVYDKGSVLLMLILLLFAMCMGILNEGITGTHYFI